MARKSETWCPIRGVLEIIEGKWTAHIISELFSGTKRHSELARLLKGINPKTLTDKLRALEQAGIVERKMYEEIPPRVEYSLSQRGQELSPVFEVMRQLGNKWQPANDKLCEHCKEETLFRRSKSVGRKTNRQKT
ncbi:MAG: helix-turn-helix transcriptional regulator [Cyanobacteria bacterium SZAS TMP-1]|nr:helix-turn-helix transcriptional regulator [Cyanobacteria bacterium SZAS TMP-1]